MTTSQVSTSPPKYFKHNSTPTSILPGPRPYDRFLPFHSNTRHLFYTSRRDFSPSLVPNHLNLPGLKEVG